MRLRSLISKDRRFARPVEGQTVADVVGIVTAKVSDSPRYLVLLFLSMLQGPSGFWIQGDAVPDIRVSNGLNVFTEVDDDPEQSRHRRPSQRHGQNQRIPVERLGRPVRHGGSRRRTRPSSPSCPRETPSRRWCSASTAARPRSPVRARRRPRRVPLGAQ